MIVRTRKPRNYTVINNTVLEDTRLSWRARGIAAYLLSKPDDWNINHVHLWQNGTEGRDAVIKALDELEATGYLRRTRRQDEQGRFTTELVLYETPTTENQESATPGKRTDSGKPGVGKPGVGKPGVLLSTEDQLLKTTTTTTSGSGCGGSDFAATLACWKENVGGRVTPIIKRDLQAFVNEYGSDQVIDAIEIAIRANNPTLRYVKGILHNRANGTQANGYNGVTLVPEDE